MGTAIGSKEEVAKTVHCHRNTKISRKKDGYSEVGIAKREVLVKFINQVVPVL